MMTESVSITRRLALARIGGFVIFGGLRLSDWRRADPKPFPHPDPRPGVTGARVVAIDDLPKKKSVRDAYEAARAYPEIFDGIFCPCDCRDGMGHRSLLSCFESKQPTGCMGCREAAEFILPLAREGKSLEEIRQAVDKKFG
jgi:uncharacterized protein with PCYCGC motif